ncbi:methyltransferase, TIGR04325 family [Bradyrhizobium symbiodeficiens]|uniref:methyltransferase, TIGR04325 family n=1 Tax=Bradyrhizobium symbiodeficiens TaxID=1404367 RepID=UPI002FE62109
MRDQLVAATERVIASDGRLFERDGVVFSTPIVPFELLTFLLRAAGRSGGTLKVLDFGGSLGSTYRQCRPFLDHLRQLRWNVVEQPAMVEIGKARFADDQLRFFDRIGDATEGSAPDVVIFSGVLQYLDDPYHVLAEACACGASTIIVDRNPVCALAQDVLAVQVVSSDIFPARLPFRIFGAGMIENAMGSAYRKVAEFGCVDSDAVLKALDVRFRGQAFERRAAEGGSHHVV